MKRAIFIFFLSITMLSCKFNGDVDFKYNLSGAMMDEDFNLRLVINYQFKNNSGHEVWLYDSESGNDFQYSENIETDENMVQKTYIIKPNKDGWSGSWGYNANYPKGIKLEKGQTVCGVWNIKYKINEDKLYENYKFEYILMYENIDKIKSDITRLSDFEKDSCRKYYVNITKQEIEKKIFK